MTKAHACETEERSASPIPMFFPAVLCKQACMHVCNKLVDNLIDRAELVYVADIERVTSQPSTLPSAALLAIGQAQI